MGLPNVKQYVKPALGVAAGIALFGALLWAIRRAPTNAITSPVKKVADIASTK